MMHLWAHLPVLAWHAHDQVTLCIATLCRLVSAHISPGWNLINEPRCYKCGTVLEGWVKEMAAYVKALDPNHLLTVGCCCHQSSALLTIRV